MFFENIAQGSMGWGLLSSLNLAGDVQKFFEGSSDEASYGHMRLQPLMFQDDIARLCLSVQSAQAGNDRISLVMGLKQLKINVEKSFYTIIGSTKKSMKLEIWFQQV